MALYFSPLSCPMATRIAAFVDALALFRQKQVRRAA